MTDGHAKILTTAHLCVVLKKRLLGHPVTGSKPFDGSCLFIVREALSSRKNADKYLPTMEKRKARALSRKSRAPEEASMG